VIQQCCGLLDNTALYKCSTLSRIVRPQHGLWADGPSLARLPSLQALTTLLCVTPKGAPGLHLQQNCVHIKIILWSSSFFWNLLDLRTKLQAQSDTDTHTHTHLEDKRTHQSPFLAPRGKSRPALK